MSDRPTLKSYFETGDVPTQSQFAELIDSLSLTTETDAKQDTLVSGTNIKTINGTSVLGSGNIQIDPLSVGTSGQIPFVNGTDDDLSYSSALTWNGRVVVEGSLKGFETTSGTTRTVLMASNTHGWVGTQSAHPLYFIVGYSANGVLDIQGRFGFGELSPTAKLHVKGSGSTSATTTFLLQNASGTELLKVTDSGLTTITQGNIVLGSSTNNRIHFRAENFGANIWSNGYTIQIYGRAASSGGVRLGGTNGNVDLEISQYRYTRFFNVGTPTNLQNGAVWFDGITLRAYIGGATKTFQFV